MKMLMERKRCEVYHDLVRGGSLNTGTCGNIGNTHYKVTLIGEVVPPVLMDMRCGER